MWFLETLVPQKADKIKLIKTTNNSLELMWNPIPGVSHYLLQVQKIDHIMEPLVKVQAQTMTKSNLIVRKPVVNSPTKLKSVPTPQMNFVQPISNPMRVQILKQEIIKPAFLSPPKHIIVSPKNVVTKSEPSQFANQLKPNTILESRAIAIAKPTTTFQIVKKMPLGLLGSFKFTDKDGTPVNTVPSASNFRVVDNFKLPMVQRERTLMYQKKLNDNKPSSSTDIETPNNNQYDDETDNIDQFDGASDPDFFQMTKLSSHHLGLDDSISDRNSYNGNEDSEQNDEAEENVSSNVLTPSQEFKTEEEKVSIFYEIDSF